MPGDGEDPTAGSDSFENPMSGAVAASDSSQSPPGVRPAIPKSMSSGGREAGHPHGVDAKEEPPEDDRFTIDPHSKKSRKSALSPAFAVLSSLFTAD